MNDVTKIRQQDAPGPAWSSANGDPILEVVNLSTTFHTESGPVNAVRGVSFDLAPGETMALVGESGSGKSVTAMSLLNMVRKPGRVEGGEVRFRGENILAMTESQLTSIRGRGMSLVFQDPVASLNPLMRIRDQLTETLRAHGSSRAAANERAVELMEMVGIPDPEARLADYPLAFSGGMSQRVMIAIALANNPDVIIADEPTTALDVTIQSQILELLAKLNRENGTAVILITHNLGIVARLCQRVAVMYAGRIVEEGRTEEIFANPKHPYTRDLLGATPRLTHPRSLPLVAIDGRPPSLREPITGCSYAPRCQLAHDRCRVDPPMTVESTGARHACWVTDEGGSLPDAVRPEVEEPSVVLQADAAPTLLEVRDLVRHFPVKRSRNAAFVRAVDGVSFTVAEGETVGLVGESGCGKSSLGKLIVGIDSPTSGSITYQGKEVAGIRGRALARYNSDVQMVFQNPMSSLNPRMTVGDMIDEPLRFHGMSGKSDRRAKVAELLELVGLDAAVADRFPHEFSGGQRQRLVIARALAVDPKLIVCDEAVSALDVSLQAQVINLLKDLQARLGLAYLFIGHDLATVRHISDRIMVMYLGEIVETGPSETVTASPQHPYTVSLLSSVPEPDPETERQRERIVLSGEVPTPLNPPAACRFHTRCPIGPAYRKDRTVCATEKPALAEVSPGHMAACHFAGELAQLGLPTERPSELGEVHRLRPLG